MGIEYTIRFDAPDTASVEGVLTRLHLVAEPKPYSGFEYRKDAASPGMPDATVRIECGGLYFCDHGGFGTEFLGCLLASLISSFGPVTVSEYE